MKKYLQFTLVMLAVAVIGFVLVSAVPHALSETPEGNLEETACEAGYDKLAESYKPIEACEPLEIYEPERIRIGITAAHFDNVGQILRHFGDGAEISVLTRSDMTDIERLSEFYAIFINCGSHNAFNSRVLNTFVSQGGIVYASDHAGCTITTAFPNKFEYRTASSQVVRDAEVVHTTLASHMRTDTLDINFDLGGWYSITELSDCAIVYIQGELADGAMTPLAISFAYGEGQVFFTSFHNSAQANFHMINFIEYLVFRIKNVEADRTLQQAAEDEGFIYRGAVFGGAGSVAMAMSPPTPNMVDTSPESWFSMESGSADWDDMFFPIENWDEATAQSVSPPSASPSTPAAPPALWADYFRYNFHGQGFMLLFGADNTFYYVTLIDPNGNRFTLNYDGTVDADVSSDVAQPVITLEYANGYRVRVMDITPGEWRFSAAPSNDSDIMIGIAVME